MKLRSQGFELTRIQTPDPGQALTEQYKLTGEVPLQLGEELVPVSVVDDLTGAGPLPPARRAIANGFVQPVVGEFSTAGIGVGPGTLAEITLVIVSPFIGSLDVRAIFDSTASVGPALMESAFTDRRRILRADEIPGAFTVADTQVASIGTRQFGYFIEASGIPFMVTFQEGKSPWILWNPPEDQGGTGQRSMLWQLETNNTGCSFTFGWTEYSYPDVPHPAP